MYKWLKNPENKVLYHYNKGSKRNTSDGWITINKGKRIGQEQVEAYRLWQYWQKEDPTVEIAIFNVCYGATSLAGFWTAGGRGRPHNKIKQGKGNKIIKERLTSALEDLKKQGKKIEIQSLCWYQGEGDSNSAFGGNNYGILFEDFIYGWTDREGVPNDDKTLYSGSLLDICKKYNSKKMDDIPVFVGRISKRIMGSKSWGDKSKWEPYLNNVRKALVDYTKKHPNSDWIDVDDIELKDAYHYTGANYCIIGERFVKKIIEALYNKK